MWLPAVIRVLDLVDTVRSFLRCMPVLLPFGSVTGFAIATQSRSIRHCLVGVPDGILGMVPGRHPGTWAAHVGLASAGAGLGSISAGGKVAVTCCP